LKAAGEARTIVVTSRGHRLSDVHWDDPNYKERTYNKWEAYGQSKTAAALFAVELDRRGRQHGVRAFSVHPGSIVTNLSRYLSDEEMGAMGAIDKSGRRAFAAYDDDRKTIPEGAATIVWCAVGEELRGKGGVYCENGDIANRIDGGNPADGALSGVMPWAVDPDAASKLWLLAERLTGTTFLAE
jgi:NAD(P)-dependent dehydrogenase (short-subunit alcohol dehydrogenase family)